MREKERDREKGGGEKDQEKRYSLRDRKISKQAKRKTRNKKKINKRKVDLPDQGYKDGR